MGGIIYEIKWQRMLIFCFARREPEDAAAQKMNSRRCIAQLVFARGRFAP
jgi:hypothetical protein